MRITAFSGQTTDLPACIQAGEAFSAHPDTLFIWETQEVSNPEHIPSASLQIELPFETGSPHRLLSPENSALKKPSSLKNKESFFVERLMP
ncbi:hypothetical protein [Gimesia maris]|uniref:hypothetical protein n=1 Tax=Gimesia maris TaxID=122 RepID=UPI00241EA0E1|nr:hypothetical protein [Gimesia maris]